MTAADRIAEIKQRLDNAKEALNANDHLYPRYALPYGFIQRAPADIAYLLAEIARLNALLDLQQQPHRQDGK